MSEDTSSATSSLQYSSAPSSSPGSPWRVRFHVQRRKPRDQRRNYKTRCGSWNKSKIRDFASAKSGLELDFVGCRPHSSRMKILAASIALALLLLASRGLSVANTSPDSAEEAIRRLNAEEVDAFLKNDRAAMARLWSDDFVVTNPLNKFVTKQRVLGMVDSGFLVITSFDRQIEYLRVYGDVVVVAGREAVVWGGRMPNAGKTENLRFTAVWMKQGGQWQQIARHANIVPPQPTVSPH
jgi:ketosteroid isomerase-like protein